MSKKEALIQAVLGSLFMALMMSGVITLNRAGLNLQWLISWRDSFFVAWPVAFTLNLTIMPKVRLIAHKIAQYDEQNNNSSR